jgi:Tol biopolymer transport system component
VLRAYSRWDSVWGVGRLVAYLSAAFVLLAAAIASSAWGAGLSYETSTASSQPSVWAAAANGGQPRRLATGFDPKLSPNGNLVAFGGANGGVFVYSSSGRFVRKATSGRTVLAWSPDSRYLALSGNGLVIFDVRTGKGRRIASGTVFGASFAPQTPDRLVYGLGSSFTSPVNLYTVGANGANRQQLTTDGVSANPVWGRLGIAFDRITPRGMNAPAYQIYLLSGGVAKQITNLPAPSLLVNGLVPLAVAAGGSHLLAGYQGQDTDQAWTVNLKTGAARRITSRRGYVTPWGISRNGRRVLIQIGAFEGPASGGTVAAVPFGGGSSTVLVRHAAAPSWNR